MRIIPCNLTSGSKWDLAHSAHALESLPVTVCCPCSGCVVARSPQGWGSAATRGPCESERLFAAGSTGPKSHFCLLIGRNSLAEANDKGGSGRDPNLFGEVSKLLSRYELWGFSLGRAKGMEDALVATRTG